VTLTPEEINLLILAVVGLLSAISGFISYKTHQTVNSRMSEMLQLTRTASRAEGLAAGRSGGNGERQS
jgi:hypothetical protein